MHAQISDDCAAVLHLTDADPNQRRQLDVFGSGGHITATDTGYALCDAAGAQLDASTSPNLVTLQSQVVAQWQSLLVDTATPSDLPSHEARVLACCQTTLLACRTAAPERPDLLLKLAVI